MPRRHDSPRKRRTREHVIADLSINHVERQVLIAGHTVERKFHDYGIDLTLSTYTQEGETEAGAMFIQVKATDHLKTVQQGQFVTIRIERVHLRSWLFELTPVVLIVYDATADRAFWLCAQTAFVGAQRFRIVQGSQWLTVRIPATQVLNSAAVDGFRSIRQAMLDRFLRSDELP